MTSILRVLKIVTITILILIALVLVGKKSYKLVIKKLDKIELAKLEQVKLVPATELCKDCDLKIPKIIHRIWIPFTPENKEIPDQYLHLDKILKDLHPDWKFMHWNEDQLNEFVKNEYPDQYDTYISYDQKTKKNDASRYFVLNKFGGVFIQHSISLYKKLDDLVKGYDIVFFAQEPTNDILASAILASVPNHKLFDMLIQNLRKTKDTHPVSATGPNFITKVLKQYIYDNGYDDGIQILSHKFLFPFNWGQKNEKHIYDNCISGSFEERYSKCHKIYPEVYGYCLWSGEWLKLVPTKK